MKENMEYFCTNCRALLGKQDGFRPELQMWTCRKCGQRLYGDAADAEAVTWYCDDCHSILSNQEGFSEKVGTWVCRVCGFQNKISPELIYDSVYDYEASIHYDEETNTYRPLPNTDK